MHKPDMSMYLVWYALWPTFQLHTQSGHNGFMSLVHVIWQFCVTGALNWLHFVVINPILHGWGAQQFVPQFVPSLYEAISTHQVCTCILWMWTPVSLDEAQFMWSHRNLSLNIDPRCSRNPRKSLGCHGSATVSNHYSISCILHPASRLAPQMVHVRLGLWVCIPATGSIRSLKPNTIANTTTACKASGAFAELHVISISTIPIYFWRCRLSQCGSN